MTVSQATVGAAIPVRVIESVDAEKMKLMAALLRDPNPIHFDVTSVQALGLGERVINQGPATLSFVTDAVAAWAGGIDKIRSLEARLQGNVFAGDRVECGGTVTAIEDGVAHLDVFARVGDHEVITGKATVVLGVSG
jgi:acyl dehydratase